MAPGGGSSASGSGRSPHPDDMLICELVFTGRQATAEEVARIAARIATAPFDPAIRKVPMKERGLSYEGIVLAERAASLDYHLVKRVVVEEQWAAGRTAAQYVDDLRRAASLPQARLAVYNRHNENHAAVLVGTSAVVPVERRGASDQAFLFVVHSADRGVMVSGYQVSGAETLNVPGNTRWLR